MALSKSVLPLRTQAAAAVARGAGWASRVSGRGRGGMIGGLLALRVDPQFIKHVGQNHRVVLVTGTNGKSTTNRMVAAALASQGQVAANLDGDNMDAGIASALNANPGASFAAIEVDELHTPHIAQALQPEAVVLLNLSRDQLDRVGEINSIERRLRQGLAALPQTTLIANCDDVLITSVAYDHPRVVWVSAGTSWAGDSAYCPRTGENIVREGAHWYSTGTLPDGRRFERPTPAWSVGPTTLHGPQGELPLPLALPGKANRGNAAQAVAAAVALGVPVAAAAAAVAQVRDVSGRYASLTVNGRRVRLLLAKNPAGWQEAMSMVNREAAVLVIAVNGQVPDGEDLSWLWDVKFESFGKLAVVAAGERGTDLAVRLTYAEVPHTLTHRPLTAIESCPPGPVEVLANYTAFRDLLRELERVGTREDQP